MTKLKILLNIICCIFSPFIYAQIGIGTPNPNPSTALELVSTNKALLLPQIALNSKDDIITIPNPAMGLLVYNIKNSDGLVPDNIKVYADLPYIFNGTQWQEMMDNKKINTFITLPEVFAKGRKTSIGTSCTNLNTASFALEIRDPNITPDGKIIAQKSGFYKFTISIGITAQPNQFNPNLYYSPGTNADDIRFSFVFKGNTGYENRSISYSAVVYMNAGDTSGNFQWILGGSNLCLNSNKINQQEVIWQYLGNL